MIYVLTPEEMRAADAQACASSSEVELMRAAGRAIAAFLERSPFQGPVVAFAGPGNNGGDGYAALAELPRNLTRIVYGTHDTPGSPARSDAIARARASGVEFRDLPADDTAAARAVDGATWSLDALFGTGARLPLDARYAPAARALDARARNVLAIDIPSGIDAASGAVSALAVRASATVTLAAMKPGLLLEPAREYAGELWVGDIGIDAAVLRAHARRYAALDDDAFLDLLPVRSLESDKRDAGAPLIVAGSQQFPGAAVLCARGAARAGAGYVTVATPSAAAPALRAHLLEQVVVTYEQHPAQDVAEDLLDIAKRNTSVAIGPGLGLDEWTGTMVRHFAQRCELPMVIDASGLFHFSKHLEILRGKACVLTPHAGEFARLSGKGTVAPGTRIERLREFVARTGIVTLLKGAATLVDDGEIVRVNPTGTSALATAGTGDVLTGIIATLLSQRLGVVDAACAGAYWHGCAGQTAAQRRPVGVIAGDVAEALPDALPARRPRERLLRYA